MSLPDRSSHTAYLGDGVYADFDQFESVILTTEDGFRVTNRIVLEPKVWHALRNWRDRIGVK